MNGLLCLKVERAANLGRDVFREDQIISGLVAELCFELLVVVLVQSEDLLAVARTTEMNIKL